MTAQGFVSTLKSQGHRETCSAFPAERACWPLALVRLSHPHLHMMCLVCLCAFLCTQSHMQENPDLFKWLTGQQEAPAEMQANPAYTVSFLLAAVCWCSQHAHTSVPPGPCDRITGCMKNFALVNSKTCSALANDGQQPGYMPTMPWHSAVASAQRGAWWGYCAAPCRCVFRHVLVCKMAAWL